MPLDGNSKKLQKKIQFENLQRKIPLTEELEEIKNELMESKTDDVISLITKTIEAKIKSEMSQLSLIFATKSELSNMNECLNEMYVKMQSFPRSYSKIVENSQHEKVDRENSTDEEKYPIISDSEEFEMIIEQENNLEKEKTVSEKMQSKNQENCDVSSKINCKEEMILNNKVNYKAESESENKDSTETETEIEMDQTTPTKLKSLDGRIKYLESKIVKIQHTLQTIQYISAKELGLTDEFPDMYKTLQNSQNEFNEDNLKSDEITSEDNMKKTSIEKSKNIGSNEVKEAALKKKPNNFYDEMFYEKRQFKRNALHYKKSNRSMLLNQKPYNKHIKSAPPLFKKDTASEVSRPLFVNL